MSGNLVQVGSDGKVRMKDGKVVVSGTGDPCCCNEPPVYCINVYRFECTSCGHPYPIGIPVRSYCGNRATSTGPEWNGTQYLVYVNTGIPCTEDSTCSIPTDLTSQYRQTHGIVTGEYAESLCKCVKLCGICYSKNTKWSIAVYNGNPNKGPKEWTQFTGVARIAIGYYGGFSWFCPKIIWDAGEIVEIQNSEEVNFNIDWESYQVQFNDATSYEGTGATTGFPAATFWTRGHPQYKDGTQCDFSGGLTSVVFPAYDTIAHPDGYGPNADAGLYGYIEQSGSHVVSVVQKGPTWQVYMRDWNDRWTNTILISTSQNECITSGSVCVDLGYGGTVTISTNPLP